METPIEIAADAPPESPEQKPAGPARFLGLEFADLIPFCILTGFSAWLWSHASASLGGSAAFVGATIGLAVAFLVRAFC